MGVSRAVEWLFIPAWRIVAMVALVALPLLMVSELSSRDQRDRLRASEEREVADAAALAAGTFGDHIVRARNSISLLLFNPRLNTAFGIDRSQVALLIGAAGQAIGDEARGIYVLDEQHRIYIAITTVGSKGTQPLRGEVEGTQQLEALAFPHPELLVKAPVVVNASGAKVRTSGSDSRISDPYPTSDGHVATTVSAAQYEWLTLAVELDLNRIAERIATQLPSGDVYLTDRNGALLMPLSSDGARVRDISRASLLRQTAARSLTSYVAPLADPATGRPLLTAIASVPGTDWRIVVARQSTFAAEIDPVLTQIEVGRIAFVLVLLVGSAVLSVAGSQIVRQRRTIAQASQEKSRFLANMSHELRTPLNAIIGFAQLLDEGISGPLSPKQSEYLRDISESGKHQLALINDILDLSKVEAGKMEFHPEAFDAGDAVRRVQTLVAPLAQSKDVRMRVEGDTPLPIEHDPARFRQVLYNLLSNAVKFTPEGGSVTTAVRSDGNGWVEFAVTDTGVGMSAADQASIFQEFKRVGSTYAQAQLGTGLGLALVKRFVEGMGGTIAVASTEGQGSTFTVRLPKAMPATATV